VLPKRIKEIMQDLSRMKPYHWFGLGLLTGLQISHHYDLSDINEKVKEKYEEIKQNIEGRRKD